MLSRIFYRCVDWNSGRIGSNEVPIVASFTDAWIETEDMKKGDFVREVASFTDAWIETNTVFGYQRPWYVASFTDAWIETALEQSVIRLS